MKRSVAIILIVLLSVAAIALVAGIGKGAMTVIDNFGDIFGSPDKPGEDASGCLFYDNCLFFYNSLFFFFICVFGNTS